MQTSAIIETAADQLGLKIDGLWPMGKGRPSLVQFTVHDPANVAFKASFCVGEDELTAFTLIAALRKVEAQFAPERIAA